MSFVTPVVTPHCPIMARPLGVDLEVRDLDLGPAKWSYDRRS